MDAADPLRTARQEDGEEKPKAAESQDDGYETSNSGEARRKPSSAEGSPAPVPPRTPPPEPPFEPLLQRPFPSPYRHFEPPAPPPHHDPEPYQHFPFPKYNQDAYFKREPEAPYDMSQQMPHQFGKRSEDLYNGIKQECEDPYSFVEDDAMCAMLGQQHHMPPHMQHHEHLPHQHPHMQMHPQQMMLNQPKKRGRKKKIKDENGMEIKTEGLEGALIPRPVKERKKHDRFNGMSEEEVSRRTLPDHLAENLDIIIIGINPGLFAAYKGHHYAGPGNHFWKCLYLSGLTREQMSADEDYKLLNFGIGFTNMVARPTKGSADLTRREIKEGSAILLEKLQTFRPKVAVFNGKLIYEVFSGKKDFCFGKQPDTIAGTNTYMWVMPSSSARCAQLPRAADKVPFYAALKKFRDYLNGLVAHVDEAELVFPDNTSRRPQEEMEIRRLTMEPEPGDTIILEDGTEVPLKKKRGRPKKIKLENGETAPPTPRAPRQPRAPANLDPNAEQPPKKKRGRPKKIRPEEQQFLMQQQQQQPPQPQPNTMLQPQLSSMSSLPHEQFMGHGDYPSQMPSPLQQGMLYQHHQQHQQMSDGSPYYQPNNGGGMDSPLDVSGSLGLGRAGYVSPRGVYASPRSQPYSPTPQRLAATPQPQGQGQQYPSSPAAFSAPSPPRGSFGSPGVRVGGTFAARSPLYASSPSYQQPSPAPQSQPRFAHEQMAYGRDPGAQSQTVPYSQSPVPAVGVMSGGNSTPFPAASPAGGTLHSYTPSPAHTPYSHHSSPAAPAPLTPAYTESHHFSQGGGSNGGSGSYGGELSHEIGAAISSPGVVSPGMATLDFEPPRDDASPMGSTDMHPGSNSNSSLSDYNKQPSASGAEVSPGPGASSGAFSNMYEREMPYDADKPHDYHYAQEQGNGVPESPRLDQLHQHPSMFPSNFNRSTPPVGEETAFSPMASTAFRPAEHHHPPGSPAEYGGTESGPGTPKPKNQDVSAKSLSGLESLVDQIPSIAEGGTGGGATGGTTEPPAPAVPALPDYTPALYPPYPAYGTPAYGNNGYGGPFVGYGGGWGTQLMRPAPGYLPDWQYGYAPGYAPYNTPYYNGYAGPPPAHHQQAHYLSASPLLDLHKNAESSVPSVPSVPSVGFGGFC